MVLGEFPENFLAAGVFATAVLGHEAYRAWIYMDELNYERGRMEVQGARTIDLPSIEREIEEYFSQDSGFLEKIRPRNSYNNGKRDALEERRWDLEGYYEELSKIEPEPEFESPRS